MDRIEAFFFSLCLVLPEIRLSGSKWPYQENERDCLLVKAGISKFGGLPEERNQSISQTFGTDFLYLEGLWGIQPGTPEEFPLSQLGGVYLVN